ncbi:amidase [Deinococcus sp. Marseille-Q6407]|uniref:amidase n=1 Tax=Deinococcus sp. Marseille-Q6407 TaxID=2969223 RepID=UPI0021BF2B23|nr:amidase [Deinococcus sp. Marseille-Q6407]
MVASAFSDPQRAWAYCPETPLAGTPGGPLSGLTFSVKDLFGVAGWPLRASTRASLPDVAPSPLVARLLELGASAAGKTHLHEIAMGILGANAFGGTEHPFLPGHVTGGSSSGAAVTAALGQVDFALGTDTGGSIRVPSAWCGVYGYKPTKNYPAWPTEGVLPLSPTCDHTGPLAREFGTILRVQEALTGAAVPQQSWAGMRVGLWRPQGWLDADAQQALSSLAARLEQQGAELLPQPVTLPNMLDAYSDIVGHEAAQVHAAALAQADPGFSPDILDKLRAGQGLTGAAVQAAYARRESYRQLLTDIFAGCDLILAPAVPCLPPRIGVEEAALPDGPTNIRLAVLRLTAPFSLLGAPAVALPSGVDWLGAQLVAPWGEDTRLLGLVRELAG